MDNITHTLVGAALAEAGLKRRTALGAATLMIGANFPDIDVIAVPLGYSLEWRRGVTHGFMALAILPFVLAWLMRVYDRRVRLRRNPTATPADYRQLTILSAIAILTHPTLDFMNTYGVRWLMPFVNKWFYADGLFIVDLWILSGLALVVYWSRRAKDPRPARVGLAAVAVYTTLMLVVTGTGRSRMAAEHPGQRLLIEPGPTIPWQRDVLIEQASGYRFGRYSLFRGIWLSPGILPKGDDHPAAGVARQLPEVRRYLGWARFPTYEVSPDGSRTLVRIADQRYDGADWASIEVALP